MINLTDVRRVYAMGGQPVHALRGVNVRIAPGEYCAIMGPSGSGKSTLLNILGCLDRPTSGSYSFENKDVSALSDAELSLLRRHRIGFVFQFFHLVPRLTARGNVELPMLFAGVPPKERAERIDRALESVGLTSRAKHRPEELSGGERQRVAIARSVVMSPSILLADEPTGNLDRHTGEEIIGLLEDMNRAGLTLIMVTHDAEVGRRARRCIRVADGEILSDTGN